MPPKKFGGRQTSAQADFKCALARERYRRDVSIAVQCDLFNSRDWFPGRAA